MSFELRIYHANPGKIDALLTRFRDHTVALFAKHNMESLGYWVSDSEPNDLFYILKHSGEAANNWQEFLADPEWIEVKANSEVAGGLVTSIEAKFLSATDFSKIK